MYLKPCLFVFCFMLCLSLLLYWNSERLLDGLEIANYYYVQTGNDSDRLLLRSTTEQAQINNNSSEDNGQPFEIDFDFKGLNEVRSSTEPSQINNDYEETNRDGVETDNYIDPLEEFHFSTYSSQSDTAASSEMYGELLGAPCIRDGYNGTCIAQHMCLSTLIDRIENTPPPICGFDGDVPMICCTDCPEQYRDVSPMVFNKDVGLMIKDGRKSRDACIDYLDSLPYKCKLSVRSFISRSWSNESMCHSINFQSMSPSGGFETSRGEHPYMALLGYGQEPGEKDWLCAGSLISEKFILTAGHCISTLKRGPVSYAALGIHKRSDPVETWQKYRIKRIIPYPGYKSPYKYHDIALLETEEAVKFNIDVLPACIDSAEDIGFSFELAYALGWGAVGPSSPSSDILLRIDINKFTDAECAKIYTNYRLLVHGYDNDTQMCYGDRQESQGHEYAQDTCEGDSGGPLSAAYSSVKCLHSLIGVTSFGSKCGTHGKAGIYTRVLYYLPWIESIVWP